MGKGVRDPEVNAGRSSGGPPRQRGRGAWPWLLLAALLLVLALAASACIASLSLLAGVLFDVSGGYDLSFAVAAASLMLASVPFFVLPEFRTR